MGYYRGNALKLFLNLLRGAKNNIAATARDAVAE
jgi:hypothetical protein